MELDETMYDRVFDINVKGTYLVDQAVLRYMIPLRRGKIVNMSSMSGKIAYPTNVAYSASKFAVIGLTQGIAKSVAEYNINVNAVCPGIVYTQIWEKMLADMAARGYRCRRILGEADFCNSNGTATDDKGCGAYVSFPFLGVCRQYDGAGDKCDRRFDHKLKQKAALFASVPKKATWQFGRCFLSPMP